MQFLKTVNKFKFTILCFVVINYLCFSEVSEIKPPRFLLFAHFDLFVHFSMFFGLTFIFFLEKYWKKKIKTFKFIENHKYIYLFIIFGLLIEIFQPILSNRSRELFDFLTDTVGCFAGLGAFKVWTQC